MGVGLLLFFFADYLFLYQDGTCIVHHIFGHEVVEKINEMYCDAFLTAHFEVPGEMFSLAMEAKRRGMGVVGSTQNILDFIKQRVQEALDRNVNDHLQFVLGTESGMVTAIVAAVRSLLGSGKSSSGGSKVKVEIVFPVSSDSMTRTSPNSSIKMGDIILPVIPGVASGEGCSIHGGCASCPYMKVSLSFNFVVFSCIDFTVFYYQSGPSAACLNEHASVYIDFSCIFGHLYASTTCLPKHTHSFHIIGYAVTPIFINLERLQEDGFVLFRRG